ncbi:hypothetical protein DIPPA_17117 [Diplonema papillatum]|nr:hypothetical protein DIPPA_17117 [Diplonema papillatum]|eukprot:gene17339-26637_t
MSGKTVLALALLVVFALLWINLSAHPTDDVIRVLKEESEEERAELNRRIAELSGKLENLDKDLAHAKTTAGTRPPQKRKPPARPAQQRAPSTAPPEQTKPPKPFLKPPMTVPKQKIPKRVLRDLDRDGAAEAATRLPVNIAPAPRWGGSKAKAAELANKEALETKKAADRTAQQLAAKPAPAWTPLGTVGVILNAQGSLRYVEQALAVVRNVRNVMPKTMSSFTIWASATHREYLEAIAAEKKFIKPQYYEEAQSPPTVLSSCPKMAAPPTALVKKIAAILMSPYDTTVVLDNDAHVCGPFDHLLPSKNANYDVGTAVAPFSRWGGSGQDPYMNLTLPDKPAARKAFQAFQERSVGVLVLRTKKPAVQQFLRQWLELFTAQTNNTKSCARYYHDQAAFREALFNHQSVVHETMFPSSKVCREGNTVSGCILKKGCATDGCDIVHCKVKQPHAHKSRLEIRGG